MNETTDFARAAAELEGDATVGAGTTHSRFVPLRPVAVASAEETRRFDLELDEILSELRVRLHEAWTASEPLHSNMELELVPAEGLWRVRLVERRGSETRTLATSHSRGR